jgi:hypothetical protein
MSLRRYAPERRGSAVGERRGVTLFAFRHLCLLILQIYKNVYVQRSS